MNKAEHEFVQLVWSFYGRHGRKHLPWRNTDNPYHILVSEMMLQQTQVERVIPKYEWFLRQWPTMADLASASLGEVLKEWQGLGYNRRAKYLLQAAQYITKDCRGVWPADQVGLERLPGVGPYTAGAIMAFAYNQPVVLIETNIRTVFLHHFFADQTDISDKEILPVIEHTLPKEAVRDWYAALMDYGSHLKRTFGNLNVRSRSYQKQSTFIGSDRQIRGAILRVLVKHSVTTDTALKKRLSEFSPDRVEVQLVALQHDGLVKRSGRTVSLP